MGIPGSESMTAGKINVQGRAASGSQSPAISAQPTVFTVPPSAPGLPPTAVPSAPLQFGGQASIPATGAGQAAQSSNPQAAAFQSPASQPANAPSANSPSTILWGATAAAAAGAFLSEALRRKQEREQRIEDYYRSRPVKIEAEGKGGRMTGKQIAKAYQAAKDNFKAKLQQAQGMGMSAEQAEQLKANVAKSGKIGASLGAAEGYIAQKEQERAERIEAYRAWRVEEATYIPPSEPAPDLQAGLQAYYEGRKAGEEDAGQASKKAEKPKNRFENWLTNLALNSPAIKVAQQNEKVRDFYLWYTSKVGDSLRSIGSFDRNPRTTAVHNQMWAGITAWEAIFQMRKEARDYTIQAVGDGRCELHHGKCYYEK